MKILYFSIRNGITFSTYLKTNVTISLNKHFSHPGPHSLKVCSMFVFLFFSQRSLTMKKGCTLVYIVVFNTIGPMVVQSLKKSRVRRRHYRSERCDSYHALCDDNWQIDVLFCIPPSLGFH